VPFPTLRSAKQKEEAACGRRTFQNKKYSTLIEMATFTRIGEDDTPSISIDASWRLSKIGKALDFLSSEVFL
jgi:hypothetical protein